MRRILQKILLGVLCISVTGLVGCGQFFPPITTTCTTNCPSTADYLYVANQSATAAGVAGFQISSATLSAVTGSPYPLSILPSALAVNPANTFLYVGSEDGLIYLYGINSDGSLTLENNGTGVASINVVSLQVDSTGGWLLVASPGALQTAVPTLTAFSINPTTGLLTAATPGAITLNGGVGTATQLVMTSNNASNDAYAYVSLGTAGVEVVTFSSTDGTLTDSGNLATKGGQDADVGLAMNPDAGYLFATETGISSLRVLAIGASGSLTEVAGSPFATGQGPSSVLVDATGSYVYVTNRTANTISAFVLTNSGSLTPVTGSPFTTGTTPVAMAEDNSKTYIAVVCAGGAPDMQVFTLDATTPGKLDPFTTAATGTDPAVAVAIATTH